jgi:hypothetical protein
MRKTKFDADSNQKGAASPVASEAGPYACPFLGLESDPETSFLFVSPGNFCHSLKPPKPVSVGYQGSVCFDIEAYQECPIFKKSSKDKLPEGFAPRHTAKTGDQKLTPSWMIFLLFVSLVLLMISIYLLVLA